MKGQKINWQECQRLGKEFEQELLQNVTLGSTKYIQGKLMASLEDYPQSEAEKLECIDSVIREFLDHSPNLSTYGFRLATMSEWYRLKDGRLLFNGELFGRMYKLSDWATKHEESLQEA